MCIFFCPKIHLFEKHTFEKWAKAAYLPVKGLQQVAKCRWHLFSDDRSGTKTAVLGYFAEGSDCGGESYGQGLF